MDLAPGEVYFDVFAFVHYFDAPEGFGYEVLDAEVAVDDEAEGGELT